MKRIVASLFRWLGIVGEAEIPARGDGEIEDFLMKIDSVFDIDGVGPVATGIIERGSLRVGDTIEVTGCGPPHRAVCKKIDTPEGLTGVSAAGNAVAVSMAGITREKLGRGAYLAAPGSVPGIDAAASPISST